MCPDLNFCIGDCCCRDGPTALVNDLLDKGAIGVRKELLVSDRNGIGFRNSDGGISPHDLIGSKEQVELLFQRDAERIDFNRRRVGPGALYRTAQIDAFAWNLRAGSGDIHSQPGDAFDLSPVQVGAGGESPRISDENANTEPLTELVPNPINISVLHAEDLLPMIDDPNVCVPGALACRNIEGM